MRDFLFQYHGVSPTTWVYLSSLLMIGLFFKFGRFWSVRNLDVLMLICLAPGLLLIHYGNHMQGKAADEESSDSVSDPVLALSTISPDRVLEPPSAQLSPGDSGMLFVSGEANKETMPDERFIAGRDVERTGYLVLFVVGGLWLARLLIDTAMVRRPLLSPNLSVGGLTFIGIALFIFLMANVIARDPAAGHVNGGERVARMDAMMAYQQDLGPGYAVLNVLQVGLSKTLVVIAHLAVVLGIALVGYRHFDNTTNGIGAAMLFLMLPYASQMTGRVDHVLPAALLVWAVLSYRRPILAGILIGTASGCVYYPLFLLPLWISFYWQRGAIRFVVSVATVLAIMAFGLFLIPGSQGFVSDLQRMFGLVKPAMSGLVGLWNPDIGGWDPVYRLPVLAAAVVLSLSLALWPTPKNLGTLLSCSAAVMLASQFWHGYGGGLYMAWYLPMLLLTIFRPNLEDRGVNTVMVAGWLRRRQRPLVPPARAA